MEEFNNFENKDNEVSVEATTPKSESSQEDFNTPDESQTVEVPDNEPQVKTEPPYVPPTYTTFNPINYTPVTEVKEYKPVSRGFKLFCLIMAAVILLSGTCLTGYFIGKSSVKNGGIGQKIELNLSSRPANKDQMSAAAVYEKVNPSVVGIVIYNSKGIGSQASGVIYSEDGYIVTNDHIYSEIAAPKFKIYTHDGKEYDADYIAGDKVSDLAVLKIKGGKFSPATFGNSDELFYGEDVVAIGRPNDATSASSITMGIVSATDRRVTTTTNYSSRLIQTDSAINPGSSGGALVNMYGQVIGITSSKLASTTQDAVGYAIPTTVMQRIVTELINKGKVVSRAKLGITYTAIDSVTAEVGDYKYVGLYVASVAEDSDLYKKVNEGDTITQINGIDVTSDNIVLDIIEQSRAGDTITVTVVSKNGVTKTLKAVLRANVSESSYTEIETPNTQTTPDTNNGGSFNFPFGE